MQARGYMVEVEYDGQTLTARGTNKAAHIALRGQERNQGDLVLERGQIARIEYVAPKLGGAVNGNLVLHTTEGRKHQLHFRRKSTAEFQALAAALG